MKVGGVKMKKNEKNHTLQFEKMYYLYNSFLVGSVTLLYKGDL
jgi:hypothetical protein